MASRISLPGPLLEHLTPLLKKASIKRDPDEAGIAVYSRQGDGACYRVGLAIEKDLNKKGEFELGAIVGIEFTEFPRLKLWQGLPRTHKAISLGTLVPESKHRLVCSKGTDWKALALQLAQWVAVAMEVLDAQREKLRAAHVSQFEQVGSSRKRSLAIFAERKQKELRARMPKGKAQAAAVITDKLNTFEIAGKLLRARSDKIEQLDSYEFTDESEAHDATVWRQRQAEFVQMACLIQAELQSAPLEPAQTGESENDPSQWSPLLCALASGLEIPIRGRQPRRYRAADCATDGYDDYRPLISFYCLLYSRSRQTVTPQQLRLMPVLFGLYAFLI